MKKVVLLLTAIVMMASCKEKAPETMVPETMVSVTDTNMETFQENVKTIKAFLAAFSVHDSTKVVSYVMDDFVWSPPSVGSDSLPRSTWEEGMKGFMNAYNDKKFTEAQYFAGLDDNQKPNGDVRVYGVWNSTFADTGKDSKLKYYAVYFFNEEGKITQQAEWYDTADLSKEF